MKKKGNRAIPDFSSKKQKPTNTSTSDLAQVREPTLQPPRVQTIKPRSTSAKGNRRGQ